jgi:hypothetical protein
MSAGLDIWDVNAQRDLDQIEAAHGAVGGSGRGRRSALDQVNQAYAVMLAAHFQEFVRRLHSECVDWLVTVIPVSVRQAVKAEWLRDRQLDKWNANQGTIGGDFGRLGITNFWARVDLIYARNNNRRATLDRVNALRNAIAHRDFDPDKLGGTTVLHLLNVQNWRRQLNHLARSIDEVMRTYIEGVVGHSPWEAEV